MTPYLIGHMGLGLTSLGSSLLRIFFSSFVLRSLFFVLLWACIRAFQWFHSRTMALYHRTVDFISDSWSNQRTQLPLLAVTGASFTLGLLLRSLFARDEHQKSVLISPRARILSTLSDDENRNLPLPNDVLPGARDVASPYGSIRVYEWGREDGPKVLLVHGITTPCIALGGVAHALVDRGCRVMLFDLYAAYPPRRSRDGLLIQCLIFSF